MDQQLDGHSSSLHDATIEQTKNMLENISLLSKTQDHTGHDDDANKPLRIESLNPALLPSNDAATTTATSQKRLIIIGDVHGCKASLDALLEKLSFAPDHDHLIFTGDLINKGPDSLGVVDLARKYSAFSVRGNHEDRILRLRQEMMAQSEESSLSSTEDESESEEEEEGEKEKGKKSDKKEDKKKDKKEKKEKKKEKKKERKKEKKEKKKDKKDKKKDKKDKKGKDQKGGKEARERDLALQLSDEQAQWLESCPMILRLGWIRGMGEVVVVHAGLLPDIELEKQDPWNVMNMRSVDFDKKKVLDSHQGTMWAKLFNKHYSTMASNKVDSTASTMTVIYGHDSKTGLAISDYTKGLDSGCVKGEKLTALVIEAGGKQSLVQQKCRDDVKE